MPLNDEDKLLLEKYFDQNISEEEMAEFQKKLADDEFADEFARMSRFEYAMGQSFLEDSALNKAPVNFPVKNNSSSLLIKIAVAAVILISGFIIFKNVQPASQEVIVAENPKNEKPEVDKNEYDGTAMPAGRLLSSGVKSSPTDMGVPKTIRFNQHVRPILSDKCFFCHGPDKHERKGDLRLDIREDAIKAKAIVPGNPKESELIKRILLPADHEDIMPTEKSHKTLSLTEKDILVKWVESGAKYETHWAYAPISRKSGTNIDQYVAARLRVEKLKFSKTADARTLSRRLHLDLTGLPPKVNALPKAGTYLQRKELEMLVDKLLASPQYGERMATWWLDAVRYANSIGYHTDVPSPTSPYRDWVIKAFNENKPFDTFSIEQIAGDLLPNPSLDQKIAAAYSRLNQISQEGGIQDKEYIKKYQSERVRTTATAWMGATLMCAECHDHKFDPYTQKDFYSFAAFFSDILEKGAYVNYGKYNDDLKKYKADNIIFEALPMSLKRREKGGGEVGPVLLMPTDEQKAKLIAAKDFKQRGEALKGVKAVLTTISSMPREVKILNRGDWMDESGEVVLPATPEFLPGSINSTKEKRLTRLDLAKWIVNKKNPLTARVFVNRMWAMFFQTGLSNVVNDFGLQGEWPEHPELLDWLAAEFMESGWDIKHLVKTIVMSRTYQQSSVGSKKLHNMDPNNRILARQTPRRLDGEFIRDMALASSDLLNYEMYGEPVYPYQPKDYWKHLKFPNRKYKPSVGKDQYRRGLYTHWQRTFLHPMFRAFDAPNRDECTMSRAESNTPLQALVLMNDPTFVEAARHLADQLSSEKSDDKKIVQAFLKVLSRNPSSQELVILKNLLKRERQRVKKDPALVEKFQSIGDFKSKKKGSDLQEATAFSAVTRAIYNLHEAITRY